MEDLPEVLTRISTQLETLENRVALLEHLAEAPTALPAPAQLQFKIEAPHPAETAAFTDTGASFAVIGRGMLGMAGAYLLRAVAESGSFPKLAVVALAIAYAGMWLLWAARVPARAWFAGGVYAGTSALILAPMLWELTLRFQVLSAAASAGVLAAFLLAAHILAWRRNLAAIVWVADLTTALTAIALLVATRVMLPFLAVLLLMSLLSETAAVRNRWMRIRPVVALAADFALWSLLYIYASPNTSRADYPILASGFLLAPALALFLVYGAGIAVRTVLLRHTISFFETIQAMIAFLFAAYAVLHLGPAASPAILGCLCLLLSPACYAAAFLRFAGPAQSRDYTVYATWSAALFLAGCFLCLPAPWLAATLGIAAIVATFYGTRTSRLILEFHGLVYLFAAALASGFLAYASHALAGPFPAPPAPIAWLVCAAAVLCYAIASQFQVNLWNHKLLQTLSASLAVGSIATLLVSALVWLTAAVTTPGSSHVAVIRTLTACSVALALAYFGPRWQRVELVWVTYATLAFAAMKLLFEDLRQGHPEFIAASIFLYAVTLLLVPRLVRTSAKTSSTLN